MKQFQFEKRFWQPILVVALCLSSFFLLFYNLGCRALWGSEGRWAEVVRQMFLSNDFFHPSINGEPYFDKPLLTYWIIALFVSFWGKLNEFVVRLPSALCGLGTVFGTFYLGQKIWDKTVAFYASFILLSSFGFIFWSRTAAADAENLAFSIAAICYYIKFNNKRDYLTYLFFYTICALGSQFKGLTAAAIPAVVILCHLIVCHKWRYHLNIKNILAFLTGAAIYILPFAYANITSQHYGQEGLCLAFRENIVRFFKAFDHKEPLYVYFYYVPFLMLPWFFLLIGSITDRVKNFAQMTKQDKWLFISFASIFFLFSISSSKRSYYILPILPFGALGIATFLTKPFSKKIWEYSLTIQALLLLSVSVIGIANPFVWPVVNKVTGYTPPANLPTSIAIYSLGALFFLIAYFFVQNIKDEPASSCRPFFLAGASIILLVGFFCNWECQLEKDRPLKPFVQKLRPLIKDIPTDSLALSKNMASVAFYLGREQPIGSLEKKSRIEPFLLKKGSKILVTRKKDLQKLQPYISNCRMILLLSCPSFKWDKRADKRLEAWKITGACSSKIAPR